MNLDDALQLFIIEARELLEEMEEALLRVEQMPDDVETINAIFRAAHTIKGSAGLFGLDHIVAFTHIAESVLVRVRNGELKIDSPLVATFLAVRDHIGSLINLLECGAEPDDKVRHVAQQLTERLRAYVGNSLPATIQTTAPPAVQAVEAPQEDGVGTDHWHLSLRFNATVLQSGLDPLAMIGYLTSFGEIAQIVTLIELVPPLSELDPEGSYLGYEIRFRTDADKAKIESAFEFVRENAQISILPPHSKIADYLRLIDEMPDDDLKLGEILVRCGTLTESELAASLNRQAGNDTAPAPKIGEVLVDQKLVQPKVVEAALDKQKQAKERSGGETGLIRVNADKLDEHINMIGELIIASAGVNLLAQQHGLPNLLEAAARLSRLVEEVRDSALTLRMVQIGATFNRFNRVVRDVSADLGKDIRLEIAGAETELDKTVVEKIGDPLTHLVRNSMDHGIEHAELRVARGKPAYGTVRLNAYHDSGSIVIEVSDDGGGLNRERILAKARERGLVKNDQHLSDQDIYNLIFEAGFSTADQVSNLSGRGVGMDVVRKNITALRGAVEIESNEGYGTTTRIRLPLTLAIIDGFLVGVSRATYVVPLDMVVECVELTADESEAAHGSDYLNLRGEVLPYIRLRQLFNVQDGDSDVLAESEDDDELALPASAASSGTALLTAEGAAALAADPELAFLLHPVKRENVVVVQYAGHRAGLVVDRLMGEFQTVIRPLGTVFGGLDGISGFTILGDGNVAMILDIPGLVRRLARREPGRRAQLAAAAAVSD
ncbi:chemotaxis protein CheA [Niveibacterium sp.]|uniref:chemotaxis protein CheA n=1 Tax=Niveibacterium sp. TaxID=2017444 RepID=UPI0035B23FF2